MAVAANSIIICRAKITRIAMATSVSHVTPCSQTVRSAIKISKHNNKLLQMIKKI
jgi:hypothetical protein